MSEGWDQTKFDAALREYVKFSGRTLQVIVNTKAYYIARKALWFTVKGDYTRMRMSLGGMVPIQRITKKGKLVNSRYLELTRARDVEAPLAVAILQARARKEGKRSVYFGVSHAKGVRLMAAAVRGLLTARARSIGFIKSGWLPSIQILAPLSDREGEPQIDRTAREIGRPKGTARPATIGFQLRAEIVNLASPIRDKKGALLSYGSRGLDQAFADETASMWEYIERKMKPDADKFNAQNR